MKSLIQKVTSIPGPSGYEKQIRDTIIEEIKDLVISYRVDALGNLIAEAGSQDPNAIKVMLSAHMDEIGIMVTHVDENGFVRFTNLGGLRMRYLPGGHVRFLDGTKGVINTERITKADYVPPMEKMYIDVGATSKEDCPVRTGDVAVFDRVYFEVGNRIISKAMDDRIGVAVLIEVLRKLSNSPHRVVAVFSTQEEVGLRGATTSAYGVDPDIGIAVDVTLAGDTPKGLKMDVSLGKGPAIKVRDGGMLADPRIVRWMVAGAESAEIPYQLEVLLGGTTDARAMQITRGGVPAGCLSIPTRYVHSPSEMVDYSDVVQGVDLLVHLLANPIELK